MKSGKLLGIAELEVDPRVVLLDAGAFLAADGRVIARSDIFTVINHQRRIGAGFVVNADKMPPDLISACRDRRLEARAITTQRNGIVTVDGIRLRVERGRYLLGTCWKSGAAKQDAPFNARDWFGWVTVGAMGLRRHEPAPPRAMRPPGTGVANLELRGKISLRSAALLVEAIEQARGKTIRLRVSSPGGQALGGDKIYGALCRHLNRVEVSIESGGAHSAAATVVMAADRRSIDSRGTMLLHQGYLTGENVTVLNVKFVATELEKHSARSIAMYALRTGAPRATAEGWINRSTCFTALDALKANLVDEVTRNGATLLRRSELVGG